YSYAQNLHLGVIFGMFRSVPMLRARGDNAGAEEAKRTTLTFVLMVSGCATVALAVAILATPDVANRRYMFETGVLTFATLLKLHYVAVYKAESRFRDLSVSAAVGSVVSLVTVGL